MARSDSVSSAGSFTVGSLCTLTVVDSYTQSGGSTSLVDSTSVIQTLDFEMQAGQLGGSGVVNGDLTVEGSFEPDGTVVVTGNYEQTATGSLEIEMSGPVPGVSHDEVVVLGNATLGGMLRVELINGFDPVALDVFQYTET